MKASDNEFPKIVLSEQGSAPASPSSGTQKLYIDSSDHHLKLKNSSGTVTDIQSTSSGPSGELGYTAKTSSFTTSSNSFVDVTDLSVTVTIGTRPVKITVYASMVDSGTTGYRAYLNIYDVTGSSQITQGVAIQESTNGQAISVVARHAPAAGSRTYKVQMRMDISGGTGRLYADSTAPAFILVEEL